MEISNIIQIILLVVVIILLAKRQDIKRPDKKHNGGQTIIDSCGLIDGRIIELSSAGFISGELIVPRFVIDELQMLADGNDSYKRAKARQGLDILNELKENDKINLTINRDKLEEFKKTDDKLVQLAKNLKADLYTTDYNLNKVAKVEGVRVLNINELALSMRPFALPGEVKKIKIIQKGSSKNQGVGYLDDGTMVVVDNASKLIGKQVSIEVERYHQTESGKMIFAKLAKSK